MPECAKHGGALFPYATPLEVWAMWQVWFRGQVLLYHLNSLQIDKVVGGPLPSLQGSFPTTPRSAGRCQNLCPPPPQMVALCGCRFGLSLWGPVQSAKTRVFFNSQVQAHPQESAGPRLLWAGHQGAAPEVWGASRRSTDPLASAHDRGVPMETAAFVLWPWFKTNGATNFSLF